jgi:16S rRNA C967 or C1407 C5-methylase (RsmB/RsmF family)
MKCLAIEASENRLKRFGKRKKQLKFLNFRNLHKKDSERLEKTTKDSRRLGKTLKDLKILWKTLHFFIAACH